MNDKRADFPCPGVMRAFDSYRSPVHGELIQSRQEKERDHVKTDTMPAQDVLVKPSKVLIRPEKFNG